MKRISVLIALSMLNAMFMTANAQLFLKVNAGYAAPTSVTPFALNNITQTATSYSEELVSGTTGGGINAGLTLGYNLTENLAIELGFAYLAGAKTEGEANTVSALGDVKTTASQSTSQVRLLPSIVVRGGGESLNPYAKVGLLIPVVGTTTTDVNTAQAVSDGAGGFVLAPVVRALETKGSFSLGFNSAFGIELGLSDNLKFFGEIAIQSLAIQGKTTTITGLTVGGQDVLPVMSTSDKVTNYLTKISLSDNVTANPNFDETKATDEIAPVAQYGSVGLNVGIILSL